MKGFAPPFLSRSFFPGIVQIWSGLFVKSAPGPPNAGTGDLNAPAATGSTPEIVVFGSASAASSSQDFGAAAFAAAEG